ncbi:MAG: dGTP triphosphohydrolase [Eubacteriales bacterium]
MDWKKLINNTRLGCEGIATDGDRNSYYRDIDRIIFSKEFRMLQAKTQVVPFPEFDATHTRLTHSLETSSVGRSLGIKIANALSLEKLEIVPDYIGAIVSAACLCHDIGNPPLGHSGEDAISQFFLDEKGSKILNNLITKDQRYDFENFEGNAIGFHLLTNSDSKKTNANGGFGLTYSTLGAFTKYPNRRTDDTIKKFAFLKKPGLLKCDINTFSKIANKMGLTEYDSNTWYRHPLAYLTEAADDICYTIVDLEDGYRNGTITFDEAIVKLTNITQFDEKTVFVSLENINDPSEKIGYMRAKAINALINMCVDVFVNNELKILNGGFENTLIKSLPFGAKEAFEELSKIEFEKVYKHKNILLTEAAGFVVLPGLLDIFVSAAFNDCDRSKKIKDCILNNMICKDKNLEYEEQNYLTLINIVQFVSLMTDNYAIKLYRELTGIQLPNY